MYIKAECMLYMWVSIDEITLTDIYTCLYWMEEGSKKNM